MDNVGGKGSHDYSEEKGSEGLVHSGRLYRILWAVARDDVQVAEMQDGDLWEKSPVCCASLYVFKKPVFGPARASWAYKPAA